MPFTPIFPYDFGGAGAINSTIEDMAPWVRLHLADGTFEGKRIVSAENLAVTKMPRVGISDKAVLRHGLGHPVRRRTARIVWHNGGTPPSAPLSALAPDKDVGVIVLTNETNVGFPDAIGEWILDRLMGNPDVDYVAAKLAAAKSRRRRHGEGASPRPRNASAAAAARRPCRHVQQSQPRRSRWSPKTAPPSPSS